MFKTHIALLFALAVLLLAPHARADLTFVEDGKPRCVIIAADADGPGMLAGKDLKYHLDRIAGCDILIVTADKAATVPAGTVQVLVGSGDLTRKLGVIAETLAPEQYRIKTFPGALVIVGADVRKGDGRIPTSPAAFYGVSHLLDRQLGVRWLWPGELGTVILRTKTIRLPDLDITGQPPLVMRSFTTQVSRTVERSSTTRQTGEEAMLWNHHHTIGRGRTEYVFGHAFGKWWDKYSRTHPEYFAKPPPGRKQVEPQWVKLCVSTPAVAEQIVAEWMAAGSPEFWNVSPNDSGGFCTCDKCRALDDPREQDPERIWNADKVDLNARYVYFWNTVLRKMKQTRPDAKLCTYSYSVYKNIKPGTKLEPGILIEFVGNYHSHDLWKIWSDAGAKIALRPNWLHMGGCAPHLPLHAMADFLTFARGNGMLQYHFDSNFGYWATQGPNYYLLARMGSRPDLSTEDVIGEWCSAFGAAAPVVRRYLDYWEKYAARVTGGEDRVGLFYQACEKLGMRKASSTVGAWRTMHLIYGDDVIKPAAAILDEAERAAVGDPTVLARIQFLREGLRHTAALRDLLAMTQGTDREVKARTPDIIARGKAVRDLERELTPRHVLYEAVLMNQYEKRGVVPFSTKKTPRLDDLAPANE